MKRKCIREVGGIRAEPGFPFGPRLVTTPFTLNLSPLALDLPQPRVHGTRAICGISLLINGIYRLIS